MKDRKDIFDEISREESRLVSLEAELVQTRERLKRLRGELRDLGQEVQISEDSQSISPSNITPLSPIAKVKLFQELFRGRTDVFAKRWENPRNGKSGYSPACLNEWLPGVCEKKKRASTGKSGLSCGRCSNQAFLQLDEEVIFNHLRGRYTIGVFPMFLDETCYFLAVDFDKESWHKDVAAFRNTCRNFDVPVAIERSRSGNGAHAWIFFSESVQASIARKMGSYILTETMTQRHELSMDSYDRFFPNQDTMPRGGFGNLIALPLQFEPRKQGNTLFVDDDLIPFESQWDFLVGMKKMKRDDVVRLAAQAKKLNRVVGIRKYTDGDDVTGIYPWLRQPSGQISEDTIFSPLPETVRAILSQRLFIDKTGLPSALLNQIKRLAAFQNPEFYKRQSMRLSTALTPRVISCIEDLPQHIALPRGCRHELENLLSAHNITLQVNDQREEGKPITSIFHGKLTPVQQQAVKSLLDDDIGVFIAPPGVGKTVVGIYLIAKRRRSTLILVHRKPLLDHWSTQLSVFLGIEQKDIGQIGGGKQKPNGFIDVAMIQSLVRKGKVKDLVADYGHVIVDECHHIPAVSFERVLTETKARYIAGFTATPQRRDGHHPIVHMQLGPIRFKVDNKSKEARPPFDHRLIVRKTYFSLQGDSAEMSPHEIYKQLMGDEKRNQLVCNDVTHALEEGRSPILLTERRDHISYFADRLGKVVRHLIVLKGGMKEKERHMVDERLASIPENEERLLLATGRYIGEGFDDARLDTLFLVLPVSWKGTLVQYAGRLNRIHPGKTEVRIYDYLDTSVPMLSRMFEKRMRGYRSLGYKRDEKSEEIM